MAQATGMPLFRIEAVKKSYHVGEVTVEGGRGGLVGRSPSRRYGGLTSNCPRGNLS